MGRVYRFPDEFDPTSFERSFTPRAEITHRIDVRRHARAKRAAMRAHASQVIVADEQVHALSNLIAARTSDREGYRRVDPRTWEPVAPTAAAGDRPALLD